VDYGSVSLDRATNTTPRVLIPAQPNRRQAIFFNDVSFGGSAIALLSLTDQLPTQTVNSPTMELYSVAIVPGATYELPLCMAEDGRLHIYNGAIWIQWVTADNLSRLLVTVIA
jgi:hypothetical protein